MSILPNLGSLPHYDADVRDSRRLAVLRQTALLDSGAEESFDRLTRLAVRILRAPVALVSLVDENRQFFKSCVGLAEPWASRRETPLSHSFCQHAVISREPLIIEDAREHPLVRDNLAIADLNVIAYAGIPLLTRDGAALGSFCVIDTVPRVWSEDEIAVLKDLAASALAEIELRLANYVAQSRLAEAERERNEKAAILESIADAFFTLDASWRFTYLNGEALRTFRRERGALLGRVIWEEFPGMVGGAFFAAYERARAEQAALTLEAFEPALERWLQARVYPTPSGLSIYVHDITQRHVEDLAMRENAQRLRLALDAANMGIWEWDLRTNYVHLQPEIVAVHRALDAQFEPVLDTMLARVHPDDRALVEQTLTQALQSPEPFRLQARIFDRESALRWRYIEGRVVPGDDGQPARLAGIDMDITAQKEAELALRSSQEQVARILETTASGIVYMNTAGQIVFANQAAEQMLGLDRPTLLARSSCSPEWNVTTAEGLPIAPTDLPFARTLSNGVAVYNYELMLGRPDGTRMVLMVNTAPVRNVAGSIEGVVSSFTDQTAHRRTIDDQRFLTEAATALSSSLDSEATLAKLAGLAVPKLADWCVVLLYNNGRLQREVSLHADLAKAPLLKQLSVLFPPDSTVARPVTQVIATGVPILLTDVLGANTLELNAEQRRLLQALGCTSMFLVPLQARSQVLGVIAYVLVRPNHTLNQADQILAQNLARHAAMSIDNALLYHAAQQAVQARDALFSMVTHDLKNPLTTILGFTDILQRRLDRNPAIDVPRFANALTNISASANKMASQLNELVDASLLGSGQPLDMMRERADLGAIVRQICEALAPTTLHHHIDVQDTGEPLIGLFDVVRIERVFANLLANAIKYSPGGIIAVALTAEQAGDRSFAVVQMRDQGIGIPAADLTRIFEQFSRASNVGDVKGSGIGLASARQIVEQHGGTIEVFSELGAGSTFVVRLPLDVF